MGLIDLCDKYFGTKNLYEVLGISEKATGKEVKKAYHKLSLLVHPDRVNDSKKLEATEKFKVLGGVHAILSDSNKRAVYDETKSVDDNDNVVSDRDWTAYWRLLFKKITEEDIIAYEKEYIGSEQEREDLKKAYLAKKGDMNYIVDHVPFLRSEHEPRIKEIINDMIEKGDVPAYKAFTHESEKKRQRRIAKENREAKESEELQRRLGLDSGSNSLELMIKQKQESRAQQLDSFIDGLASKYGDGKKTKGRKRKAASASSAEPKINKRNK